MVPQYILQQLRISKVDDPEDGSKALVSDSRASRWAVHLIQDPKKSFYKALCQLRVLFHQLGSCIFSTNLLVSPWRESTSRVCVDNSFFILRKQTQWYLYINLLRLVLPALGLARGFGFLWIPRAVPVSSLICCIELKSIVYTRPRVDKLISSSPFWWAVCREYPIDPQHQYFIWYDPHNCVCIKTWSPLSIFQVDNLY